MLSLFCRLQVKKVSNYDSETYEIIHLKGMLQPISGRKSFNPNILESEFNHHLKPAKLSILFQAMSLFLWVIGISPTELEPRYLSPSLR